MAKKKQLSIEQRARIDILAAEGFSQRSIAKKKLEISKFGVQYSLQRKTETGVNEGRKRMKIQGVDLNFWPVVYIYFSHFVSIKVYTSLISCHSFQFLKIFSTKLANKVLDFMHIMLHLNDKQIDCVFLLQNLLDSSLVLLIFKRLVLN